MSSTPIRRSLRRKRHTKSTDVIGSPASKKKSPLRDDKDDEASSNSAESQAYTTQRPSRSQVVSTPREPLFSPKNDQSNPTSEKLCSTPCTIRDSNRVRQGSHPQRQHSPDAPFICSQLCGTQECEVVWDCNSPGFSKDDLKRMPGGDNGEAGGSPLTFIASLPHRTLFPKAKGRPSPTASVESTTAQLDELLDQLRKGENNPGESRDLASLPTLLETIHKNPQIDGSSPMIPKEVSSAPVLLPGLLDRTSSQPFNVVDENYQDETVNLANDLDDSLFGGDDLNVAICDTSAIDFLSLRKTLSVASNEVDKADEGKDHSSVSTDMFDDDLFNDSVIRTTQAMEEALANTDSGNLMARMCKGKDTSELKALKQSDYKSFKRHNTREDPISKFLSADGTKEEDVRVSGGRTSDRQANTYSRTIHKSTGVKQSTRTVHNIAQTTSIVDTQAANQDSSNCDTKITASSNQLDSFNTCDPNVRKNSVYNSICRPILGNPHTSADDPPQRQIRNSFRLGSVASLPQKNVLPNKFRSNSVVLSSGKPISSEIEKCVSARGDTCKNSVDSVLVKSGKSSPLFKERISEDACSSLREHCVLENTYKSNGMLCVPGNEGAKLSKAPGIQGMKKDYFNHDHQLTRVPLEKSVYRNSVSSQIGRLADKNQTVRGPMLRSHSTGNAKVTNSDLSTTVRRSNSSLEGDVSREFEEDDEFFESLLSVLPEDEEQLVEKSKLQSEAHMLVRKKNVSPHGQKCTKNATRFQESIEACPKPSSSRGIHTSSLLMLVPNNLGNVRKITSEPEEQIVNNIPLEVAQINSKSNGLAKNQKNSRPGTYKLSSVFMETSCNVKQEGRVDRKPTGFSNPATTHLQTSDILDDDLFEDDVLTLLDKVESQYGSQPPQSEMSNSQSSYSQQLRCTQDEIARKKEAAQRLRQEKQKQRHQRREYPPVC